MLLQEAEIGTRPPVLRTPVGAGGDRGVVGIACGIEVADAALHGGIGPVARKVGEKCLQGRHCRVTVPVYGPAHGPFTILGFCSPLLATKCTRSRAKAWVRDRVWQ